MLAMMAALVLVTDGPIHLNVRSFACNFLSSF